MTQIRIQYTPTPAPERNESPRVRPLTHHEILGLMAPFSAHGRHADLAASQRAERRLVFKPIEHPPTDERPLRLIETLLLDLPEDGTPSLTRRVQDDSGLTSNLTTRGREIAELLARIESVPVRRQFQVHGGVPIARSYAIGEQGGPPAFTEARARLAGINLEARADSFAGHVLDLRLTADPGFKLLIPEDLTAVLGWDWRPLKEFVSLWRGSIRVASKDPRRTRDIEAKLGRTLVHLARILASRPADFHDRHRRARWRVAFQRGIPLGVGLLIVALTPAIQWLDMADDSLLKMLIFHAPPFMLAAMFMMREMPRIEIPPIPRPLTQEHWVTRLETSR